MAQAPANLGSTEFHGVCATCHGMQGQGGYGPNLSNNPLLTQRAGLLSIVQNGRALMPAVGDTWTQRAAAGARDVREIARLQGSSEWRLGRRPIR